MKMLRFTYWRDRKTKIVHILEMQLVPRVEWKMEEDPRIPISGWGTLCGVVRPDAEPGRARNPATCIECIARSAHG